VDKERVRRWLRNCGIAAAWVFIVIGVHSAVHNAAPDRMTFSECLERHDDALGFHISAEKQRHRGE